MNGSATSGKYDPRSSVWCRESGFETDCINLKTAMTMTFIFKWGKYHPAFCMQGMHTPFLLDYSQHFTRTITKIEPKPPKLMIGR
jgi:hypothetical protein